MVRLALLIEREWGKRGEQLTVRRRSAGRLVSAGRVRPECKRREIVSDMLRSAGRALPSSRWSPVRVRLNEEKARRSSYLGHALDDGDGLVELRRHFV